MPSSSLHFSYPVLRTVGCIQTRLFLPPHRLLPLLPLNSRADKLHSYSHLYPSLYPPSVLPVCPASPRFFFAFELLCDSKLSPPIGARCISLFFSYPVNPRPLLSLFLFIRFPCFVAINIRRDVIFNSAPLVDICSCRAMMEATRQTDMRFISNHCQSDDLTLCIFNLLLIFIQFNNI